MAERISLALAQQVVELEVSALDFTQQSKKALKSKEDLLRKMKEALQRGHSEMAKQYAQEAVALEKTAVASEIMAARVRSSAVRLEAAIQARVAVHSLARISATVAGIRGMTDAAAVDAALRQFDQIMNSLEQSATATSAGLAAKQQDDAAVARLLEQAQAEVDLGGALPDLPSVPGAVPVATPTADDDLMRRYEAIIRRAS